MFALLFRILAIVLILVAVVLEVAGSGIAAGTLQIFRDAGLASFIASFLF